MKKFFRHAILGLSLATPATAVGQSYRYQWQTNVQANDNSVHVNQTQINIIPPPVQETVSHGPADLATYARRPLADGRIGYEEIWVGPRMISKHLVLLTTPGDHNDDWTIIDKATGTVLSHKTVNITHTN